jgi:hypothetical protein
MEPIIWWTVPEFAPVSGPDQANALGSALDSFRQAHAGQPVTVRVRPAHGPGGVTAFLTAAARAAPDSLPNLVVLPLDVLADDAVQAVLLASWDQLATKELQGLFPFAATSVTNRDGAAMGLPFAVDVVHLLTRDTAPPAAWSELGETGRWLVPAPAPDCRSLSPVLALAAAASPAASRLDGSDVAGLAGPLDALGRAYRARRVLPGPVAEGPAGAWDALLGGEAPGAAVSGGLFIHQQAGQPQLAWGPSDPDQAVRGAGCGWAFAIPARNDRRADRAAELARWLVAPARNAWVMDAGYLPATREQWRSNVGRALEEQADPGYVSFLKAQLEAAVPVVGPAGWASTLTSAYAEALGSQPTAASKP